MPGPTHPYRCQYSPMKMSLCSRYARYSSWGGWGRAPNSNITGVSRSAATARETAAPLVRELLQGGADEHPEALVRGPNGHVTPEAGTPPAG